MTTSWSSSCPTMTWQTQQQGEKDQSEKMPVELCPNKRSSAPISSGNGMDRKVRRSSSSSSSRCSSRCRRTLGRSRKAGGGGMGETDRLAAIASFLHIVVFFFLLLSTCSSCENQDENAGQVRVVDDGTRLRLQRTQDESNLPNSLGLLDRAPDSGSPSVSAFLRVNRDVQEKKQKKKRTPKRSKRAEGDVDGDGDDKYYDGVDVNYIGQVVDFASQTIKRSEEPFVDLKGLSKAVKVVARGRGDAASASSSMMTATIARTDDHSQSQRGGDFESAGDVRGVFSVSLRRMLSLSHSYFSRQAMEMVEPYSATTMPPTSVYSGNVTSDMPPVNRLLSLVSLSSASPSSSSSASDLVPVGHVANSVNVTEICSLIGEEHGKCVVWSTSTGHLVEIYSPKYADQAECASFLLLPAENTWRKDVRIVLYLLGILYIFIGLINITAVFMRAMEVIVNQKCIVLRRNPVTGHLDKHVGRIWNNTVADITLLAFGTSAPQISLALIDAVQTLGQPPGGNAGCLALLSLLEGDGCRAGSIKKIQNFGVWVVEFTWSIWAYIWLILIVQVWTPGVITVTEAVMTILQFPVLILHAYGQDKKWFSSGNRLKVWRAIMQRQTLHSASSLTPLDDADDARNHVLPSSADHSGHIEVEEEGGGDRRLSWSSPPHHKFSGSRRPSFQVEGAMHPQHQDFWMHRHSIRMSPMPMEPGREHADHYPSRRPSAPVNHESSINPCHKRATESIDRGAGRQSGSHTVALQDHQPPPSCAAQDVPPLSRALSFVEPLGWEDIKSLWRDQFCDAMTVKGTTSGDDSEEPADPSFTDFILHFICFFWKVLFAFIPPPEIWHGRIAFACAVGWIMAMSYVLIDLANLFGCASGMDPFVLAITILATGTCLPDLIGSYIAAQNEVTADSAIANINASNCINVFVGLGCPWLVASIYNRLVLNQEFPIASRGTGFSVMIFCIAEFSATALMLGRRYVFGGELGGPRKFAVISSIVWLLHWAFYIIMSSLRSYGSI
ncbi:hypothetical protein CBR_g22437 [Chara braunii]|uniref:Sodium/calcium exchanger membrane region domain-containing protein n=1 Tax=Chara braunii TaxID=69332 RepID=A0A388JUZ0_CHABU|nr:hypothetical protein CBR_g22437 [Chara braunii]|eukprot:GBG61639.1 hypothetical protein CBR_g22437 [Chara braunii]